MIPAEKAALAMAKRGGLHDGNGNGSATPQKSHGKSRSSSRPLGFSPLLLCFCIANLLLFLLQLFLLCQLSIPSACHLAPFSFLSIGHLCRDVIHSTYHPRGKKDAQDLAEADFLTSPTSSSHARPVDPQGHQTTSTNAHDRPYRHARLVHRTRLFRRDNGPVK